MYSYACQRKSEKGQVNGYAGLGADGRVPSAQLPAGQGAPVWGDVTGTLADQTDLQTALDGLADDLTAHEAALDPHTIYTTVPECDLLYEAAGAVALHALVHAPSNAQKNSDITKAEIEAKLTGEIASHTHAGGSLTLSQVYPVGCIYTSTVSTNPATVFGMGTWAAFGAGRVLVGLDAGQTEFDTVEETGGAKTHTLQTSEMPAHTHVITSQTATTGGATSYEHGTLDTSSAEAEATEVTGSTGGGGAHNNLQPYITVHFFKRTA